MLLDEAIRHCEERAQCKDACGMEHAQLAKWLRRLVEAEALLVKISASHSILAEEEYQRNGGFNNQHFAYIAEEKVCEYLVEHSLFDSVEKEIARLELLREKR